MRISVILTASIILLAGDAAMACGRCRGGHARPRRAVCQAQARPVAVAYAAPVAYSMPVATTQMAYSPATYAPPVASQPPAAAPAAPGSVQPTYNYAAASQEQPAYYYTYDESGKMVVRQWVDFLFRGGREAGMPRPPLPVIGAIMNNR